MPTGVTEAPAGDNLGADGLTVAAGALTNHLKDRAPVARAAAAKAFSVAIACPA